MTRRIDGPRDTIAQGEVRAAQTGEVGSAQWKQALLADPDAAELELARQVVTQLAQRDPAPLRQVVQQLAEGAKLPSVEATFRQLAAEARQLTAP